MKKLILSVIVTLFISTAFAAEKEPNPKDSFNGIYKELSKMLNLSSGNQSLNEDVLVKVKITLNDNHEIVVLSTNTNNEDLNYYIKNSLNYQKIASEDLSVGRNFVFLVRFEM